MEITRTPLLALTRWSALFPAVDRNKQERLSGFKPLTMQRLRQLEIDGGDVRLFNSGQYNASTSSAMAGEYLNDGEVILFPEGGSANGIKYHNGKFCYANCYVCQPRNPRIISTKYLYYWMEEHAKDIDRYFYGAAIRKPDMNSILNMTVDLPPIEYQRMACRILDGLDSRTDEIRSQSDNIKQQIQELTDDIFSSLVQERTET